MAKIRTRCRAMTDGKIRGSAERFGETMGEASVETAKCVNLEAVHSGKAKAEWRNNTQAKLRIHEDGSGLFEFTRGGKNLSIRWSAEEMPLELFASFDGVEGVLVPDTEETPR